MKLKKVAALCSQRGVFYLLDQADGQGEVVCQWLGNGAACYPIAGLPYMEMDHVCAMFDIPEKKREKMMFRHDAAPDGINWEDSDQEERQLDDPRLCLRCGGREVLPLRTSQGIVFIQEKYLAPLDNLEYLRLYERRSRSGGVYIVAKIGMVVQAVIMPVDIVNEDFVGKMDELTEMCRAALLKKNRAQAERDRGQGTLLSEGEDDGAARNCYNCGFGGDGEEVDDRGRCWLHNGEPDFEQPDKNIGCGEWKQREKEEAR